MKNTSMVLKMGSLVILAQLAAPLAARADGKSACPLPNDGYTLGSKAEVDGMCARVQDKSSTSCKADSSTISMGGGSGTITNKITCTTPYEGTCDLMPGSLRPSGLVGYSMNCSFKINGKTVLTTYGMEDVAEGSVWRDPWNPAWTLRSTPSAYDGSGGGFTGGDFTPPTAPTVKIESPKPAPMAGNPMPPIVPNPDLGAIYHEAGKTAIKNALAMQGGGAATASVREKKRGLASADKTNQGAHSTDADNDKNTLANGKNGQTVMTGPAATTSTGDGPQLSMMGGSDEQAKTDENSAENAAKAGEGKLAGIDGFGAAGGAGGRGNGRDADTGMGDGYKNGYGKMKVKFGEGANGAAGPRDGLNADVGLGGKGKGGAKKSIFQIVKRGYTRAEKLYIYGN